VKLTEVGAVQVTGGGSMTPVPTTTVTGVTTVWPFEFLAVSLTT
jgi:hypothetical protein